jgi:hypothetical protein
MVLAGEWCRDRSVDDRNGLIAIGEGSRTDHVQSEPRAAIARYRTSLILNSSQHLSPTAIVLTNPGWSPMPVEAK